MKPYAPRATPLTHEEETLTGRLQSRPLDHVLLDRLRCVLAFAGLMAVLVDPPDPQGLAGLTYFSITAYLAYAIVLAAGRRTSSGRWPHWVDVAFFAWLLWLTGGSHSIFFVCFFFPVMVAAFAHGFREGLLVTVVSTASFLAIATFGPAAAAVELNRLLLRPIYLLTLGYMIARWGEHEMRFKRQLIFLQALTRGRNPRLGADFAIGSTLQKLREFYGAVECVLLPAGPGPARARASSTDSVAAPVSALLSHMAPDRAITYDGRRRWLAAGGAYAYDVSGNMPRLRLPAQLYADAAHALSATTLLAVPHLDPGGAQGCLLVAAHVPFAPEDVAFMLQVSAALSVIVENLQFVDEIVSGVAERERARTSLDVHDRTVQPYIALRMGLQALHRDVDEDSEVKNRVSELVAMADTTVEDLRGYIVRRREEALSSSNALASAVEEHAQRYERFFGLHVDVEIDAGPAFGALTADIYNIIIEGLSNIRKHTRASRAYVRVRRDPAAVQVQIGNDAADGRATDFTPGSILARAQSLGGSVRVALQDGCTWVHVSVPV